MAIIDIIITRSLLGHTLHDDDSLLHTPYEDWTVLDWIGLA